MVALQAIGLLWLVWRRLTDAPAPADDTERLQATADAIIDAGHAHSERVERELRSEVQGSARGTRQELSAALSQFQRLLLTQSGEAGRTQFEASERRLAGLQQSMEQRLDAVQASVEQRLASLQADNERKLEQMRATVDEKLHATLEARLGESFKQVADRLEQVHRGLGEMQTLAQGVGDLKRVLGNVKTRGLLGEVQLAALLEQVFTVEQYATNVVTVPGSNDRVEFAIRLPGRGAAGHEAPVWLPIDAKFPREDYERLLDAQDRADKSAAEMAGRALEQRVRDEART
ncbi:MAG: DNA recombination protein RmuC, partial [Sphaerotilus sp.]|nr:DNA recombination protein RmuC [Sphaerotilus sp.]